MRLFHPMQTQIILYTLPKHLQVNCLTSTLLNRYQKGKISVFYGSLQEVYRAINQFSGLQDIKKSGYAHRDIKPKNIMLKILPDKTAVPKYIDFGLSEPLTEKNPSSIGTGGYMPVEMNSCAETKTCPDLDTHKQDVFALGLVFSQILLSQQMTPRILSDKPYREVNWKSPVLEDLSPEKKTVLHGMLDPDPQKRWTIDMVLHDPWVAKGAKKPNAKWSKRE